jgi:hypothetical protein
MIETAHTTRCMPYINAVQPLYRRVNASWFFGKSNATALSHQSCAA